MIGVGAGLAIGAATPFAVAALFAPVLPLPLAPAIYPGAAVRPPPVRRRPCQRNLHFPAEADPGRAWQPAAKQPNSTSIVLATSHFLCGASCALAMI